MNKSQALTRKQILSNALALYSMQHVKDLDNTKKLKALVYQLKEFKIQKNGLQTKAKIISRKIGEKKRCNEPTDELKKKMKQLSSQIKELNTSITQTEDSILFFFTANENSSIHSTIKSADRQYFISEIQHQDIITSFSNIDQEQWNSYVNKNPAASIYHRIEWQKIVRECYGHECLYLTASINNSLVGLLPLIHLNSPMFGNFLVSLPWFKTGGAVADHPLIEQTLIEAANKHAKEHGIKYIEYRDDIPRVTQPEQANKVNMILELPESKQQLWDSFPSKLKSQIKRPKRENPQVLSGGVELLDEFYKVYARNMRDLGSPAHSKKFIKYTVQTFADESRFFIIRFNNRPVSAGLLLSNKDTLDIPLASTVRDVNHLSMNMLLYWEILKYAVNTGYRYFNFGRSSKGSGTYRFKYQWGARPKQLHWHYWLNENVGLPELNTSNPKYQLVIYMWKLLPVWLASWLGPHLVKYLP